MCVLKASSPNLFPEEMIKKGRREPQFGGFSAFFLLRFVWELQGAGFETFLGVSTMHLLCLLTS